MENHQVNNFVTEQSTHIKYLATCTECHAMQHIAMVPHLHTSLLMQEY